MPLFLIERHIPDAHRLSPEQLQDIADKSTCAMKHLNGYRWHQSYIAGDTIFCVHEAPDAEMVREHSRRGGFPVQRVTEINAVFDGSYARQHQPQPA